MKQSTWVSGGRTRSKAHGASRRSRLIAWSTVLAIAALAAVGVLMYLAYQRASGDLIIERDRQLAYLSAARLKENLTGFTDLLTGLARTPEVYGLNAEEQQAALGRAANRLVVFDGGVVLLDNFGKVLYTEPPRPELHGQDWSSRDFFARLLVLPDAAFSDVIPDGPDGAPVVAIAVPVLGEQSEFAGALVGMFRLDAPTASSFYGSIVRLRIGQTGNTFIVDSQGNIIYDSGASGALGQAAKARQLDLAAAPAMQEASRTRDAEGHEIVAARSPVPGTDWSLITEDDWNELTASTRRYAGILLGVLTLGMLLPALGIVLLVRERNAQTLEREREDQELRITGLIQKNLLPRQVPALPGWNLSVFYRPAALSGGDFYDFLFLPDGRLMLALGDIAERSVPATVAIATTRATLRSTARRMLPPAAALAESNTMLCPEMPRNMCVFSVYALLDPASGRLVFANAGFLPPWLRHKGRAERLTLAGRPLGLLLDADYEQSELVLQPGDYVVFCGNGLIEARNPQGEMFGFARLKSVLERQAEDSDDLLGMLRAELEEFTGKGWAQEDDITVVVLERTWDSGRD